jgi:hypothetical protein
MYQIGKALVSLYIWIIAIILSIGIMATGSCGEKEMSSAQTNLIVPRSSHCSTLLNDDTVLISGGIGANEETIDTAEILNPTTGNIGQVIKKHLPRAGHRCIRLSTGKVLLIGGTDAQRRPEARIELFDPGTREFKEVAKLDTARLYHQAILLPNDQVLVVGGMNSNGEAVNSLELIDVPAGKVTKLSAAMTYRRYQHEAELLKTGMILITGGTGDSQSRLTAELFDYRKQTFTSPIKMSVERVIHTSTLLRDNRIFTFSNGEGELFDPTTQKFTKVSGIGEPKIRDSHTATLLNDGTVLILGGGIPDFEEHILGAPILYDPKNSSYIKLGGNNALVDRADHAAVLMSNGMVLITGGRTIWTTGDEKIFLYEPGGRQFRLI